MEKYGYDDGINELLSHEVTIEKTNESNFADDKIKYKVGETKYNGLRNPTAKVHYEEYVIMNNGVENSGTRGDYTVNISDEKSMDVNVYTPIAINSPEVETSNFVNHSNYNNGVIQKGAEFTLTLKCKEDFKGVIYTSDLPTIDKYIKNYYVIFDFDVRLKKVSGDDKNEEVPKGTPIEVSKNNPVVKAIPTGYEGNAGVSQAESDITVIASTINTSDVLISQTYSTKDNVENVKSNLNNLSSQILSVTDGNLNNYEAYDIDMKADSHYFAKLTKHTYTIARLYDFKITDCYDLDFKNVFRKSTENDVNASTGIRYFSGIKSLFVYDEYYNTLIDRNGINIANTSQKTILPLGPYKNTDTSYIKAPKLGYRFSFDLKTFGYYDENNENINRTIKITPSYYYISKDGNNFIKDVKLYYKNSSGKYVTFDQSNYTISFKPNDGYRYIDNLTATQNTDNMSTQLLNLTVGHDFTLDNRMMSTSNDNFVQAWYGEYKVPNSTIVLKESDTDLNNPLTDGYLGVIFKIECIDKYKQNNPITVLYDKNDINASGENTSQWDYEGYLGFKNYGSAVSNGELSIQLEKGTWAITDDLYQDIKGTVALFDLDNRAASDFE